MIGHHLLRASTGVIALCAAANAWAQAPAAGQGSPPTGTSENPELAQADDNVVIVTAQRREARSLDVPISMTALTGELLERRGASSLQDVQYSVPGLSSFEYGPGLERIQLRGISNAQGLPTVGRYLDEVPINLDVQGTAIDIRFIDMERVEVLRGPQGSLYGEGSLGGTIRFITARPDTSQVSGGMEAQVGAVTDGDVSWRANGHVNIPIVADRVALRVAGGYERQGGWIDRPGTGAEDVNGTNIWTVRASLVARISDRADLTLSTLHQESDQASQNFGVNRQTAFTVPTPNVQNFEVASATFNYDLGFATLTNAFGYTNSSTASVTDLTPFYGPFLPFPPGFITEISLNASVQHRIFTNELRLVSASGGALSWIVGVNYRNSRYDQRSSTATAPNPAPFVLLDFVSLGRSESWAPFAELGYRLTERLILRAGLRYYSDERRQANQLVSFGAPSADAEDARFESLNPSFNLTYHLAQNSIIYANASKGFRSGGFNLAGVPTNRDFSPETLWTYEVGTKHSLLGGRLVLEGDIYYNSWSGVQSSFTTGQGITLTTNGGDASGWGADLSVTARPARNLQIGGTFGWNNMGYDRVPPNGDKAVGDPLDFNLEQSWSAFVDYRHPLAGSSALFMRLDYQHAGKSRATLRSPVFNQFIAIPARDLIGARFGLETGRVQVTLFVDNLLDEDAVILPGPFGAILENVEQRPRTAGVNVRARF